MGKKVVGLLLVIVMIVGFVGCSRLMGAAETEAAAQPTMLTSLDEAEMPTVAPTVQPTPEPTPAPTPVNYLQNLPQLSLGDQFMPAKSIEGIDPFNDKVIALTFDDGPHPENTPRLLDILKENGAVATFFMVGTNVEAYPDIVKRVYEEGNEIGTHSWNHPDLMKLSTDQILTEQYGKANDAIQAATGLRATIDRPPYGSMTPERAMELGREQIIWSVDPQDWKEEYKNADSIYDNVLNGSNSGGKACDGAVILSHDIHTTTIDAYARIIPELKSQGYKFVTVTQMIQIAELRGEKVEYKFFKSKTAEDAVQSAGTAETQEPAAS